MAFIEKYGWIIIAALVLIIVGLSAYIVGYINAERSIQPVVNTTIVYVYVTPTPTPTPLPPNVIMYGNQPVAIIGKDTPAQYDNNQINSSDVPAITFNGHLTGQGYYNMTSGVFNYHYLPNNTTVDMIKTAGDTNVDWTLTYNPYLETYNRGKGDMTIGTVDSHGIYHLPIDDREEQPAPPLLHVPRDDIT